MDINDLDNMPEDGKNSIGMIPALTFTGGLDFEQEVHLQTISECIDRGEQYTMALAKGDEKLCHDFEPLLRLLTGISNGAAVPIAKRVMEDGVHPVCAIKEVIAGVGGLMFFGGIEYAKAMGLNGVGVPLPKKEYEADQYPEQKPGGSGDLKKDLAHIEELLAKLESDSTDPDGRNE